MSFDLQNVATQAEKYINEHLFDPDGLMYSFIDVQTGKPFEEDYVVRSAFCAGLKNDVGCSKSWSVADRASLDSWACWYYEDTTATTGFYMPLS